MPAAVRPPVPAHRRRQGTSNERCPILLQGPGRGGCRGRACRLRHGPHRQSERSAGAVQSRSREDQRGLRQGHPAPGGPGLCRLHAHAGAARGGELLLQCERCLLGGEQPAAGQARPRRRGHHARGHEHRAGDRRPDRHRHPGRPAQVQGRLRPDAGRVGRAARAVPGAAAVRAQHGA